MVRFFAGSQGLADEDNSNSHGAQMAGLPDQAEIVIAGGGIVGLTLARELVLKGFNSIVVLEKELHPAAHASGRNSGVLHAGIYYAPDSFKARCCLSGNFKMRRYCRENGLKLLETGKVIVTRSESEIPGLEELFRRARANGANVEMITPQELRRIEPSARTVQSALWSKYTAMVDPKQVVKTLWNELDGRREVTLLPGTRFVNVDGSSSVVTNRGIVRFDIFINAAGAYCDQVAKCFGVGTHLRLIPFKGMYWKLATGAPIDVRGNIYPVPDIRNPFLGIHFTRNVHGDTYMGPTAIPAFGRENYGLLEGMDAEALKILSMDVAMLLKNPKFRAVAFEEPRKYLKTYFFKDAAKLVSGLTMDHLEPSSKVGIRPQLIDWRTKELMMDFLVVRKDNTIHVLNPISPAFTSSMHLAETVVKQYLP
jgi:L-2-hydroxyglutarate oxidase LhgO